MIRAAIIGCGKIADVHAQQIAAISNAALVAVLDAEEMMAAQLAERYKVPTYYCDIRDMLDKERIDVVHITTPPQSHFNLAVQCLDKGCNVYIEKPFTINTEEAINLIAFANKKGLKLTVGHNLQFTNIAAQMRAYIRNGFLGEKPVHMESIYCYDLGNRVYAKSFLGDSNHWVRTLPGKLLQNIISHGIAKIAEFLPSENPLVIAHAFTSDFLREIGIEDIRDELRVIIDDRNGCTAYFTFSSQIKPPLHQFRILGSQRGLILDEDNLSIVKLDSSNYKSYLRYLLGPRFIGKEYRRNSNKNFALLLRSKLFINPMKTLIEAFYDSISLGAPLPISYREIVTVSRIMDSIFEQIDPRNTTI